MSVLSVIPDFGVFNEAVIEEYVGGKQCFSVGKRIVAAGEVAEARVVDAKTVALYVHAEKTSDKNYEVSIQFDAANLIHAVSCACEARALAHTKCKHAAAALLALVCVKNYADDAQKPRWAHRPGVHQRFKIPGRAYRIAARADDTWSQTVARFTAPLPRHNDSRWQAHQRPD
jgi:uncharacterized Zn finger protein